MELGVVDDAQLPFFRAMRGIAFLILVYLVAGLAACGGDERDSARRAAAPTELRDARPATTPARPARSSPDAGGRPRRRAERRQSALRRRIERAEAQEEAEGKARRRSALAAHRARRRHAEERARRRSARRLRAIREARARQPDRVARAAVEGVLKVLEIKARVASVTVARGRVTVSIQARRPCPIPADARDAIRHTVLVAVPRARTAAVAVSDCDAS